MTSLIIAVISGLLSVIVGSAGISRAFLSYMQQTSLLFTPEVSSESLGMLGIIICEIIINLAFSISGTALLIFKDSKHVKTFSFAAGVSRLALLTATLAAYWSPAWYHIFDPAGKNQYAYILMFLTLVQAGGFLCAKKKSK